ncbi:hypothetical protein KAR91_02555 [Candidatus Pacearchaeota archaeon]|nr:hypothetical protein [Candidatus Pacearchaeota archaeon]
MAETVFSVELMLAGCACTDESLAFENPDEREMPTRYIWLPRSQIENLEEVMDSLPEGSLWPIRQQVELHVPQWLLEQKGIDGYAEEIEEEVY